MKKLMMTAVVLFASAAAFAGDSDALKAVLKTKTLADAETLVKSNIGQMASAQEKAKAYNKLVDLAMDKVNKETTIITSNQMAQQLGTGKEEAYDTLGMADAIVKAIDYAILCNEFDQQPNEKGKVAPKFAEKNAQRIWAVRSNLVNVGQTEAQKGADSNVLKYWGAFVDSSDNPLFASQDKKSQEEYIGQVAYFAGRYAFQAGDIDRCVRYLDVAMKDESQKADALNYKLYALSQQLHSRADSVKYAEQLQGILANDPENGVVIETLSNIYAGLGDETAQLQVLDNVLARNPNNFTALADKGLFYMNKNDVDNAIPYLRKAAEVSPENVPVLTYLGACLSAQAGAQEDQAKAQALYQEAVAALDKAKALDPDKTQARWGYVRYQAYYGLYGPDDAKTKQAEEESR